MPIVTSPCQPVQTEQSIDRHIKNSFQYFNDNQSITKFDVSAVRSAYG